MQWAIHRPHKKFTLLFCPSPNVFFYIFVFTLALSFVLIPHVHGRTITRGWRKEEERWEEFFTHIKNLRALYRKEISLVNGVWTVGSCEFFLFCNSTFSLSLHVVLFSNQLFNFCLEAIQNYLHLVLAAQSICRAKSSATHILMYKNCSPLRKGV